MKTMISVFTILTLSVIALPTFAEDDGVDPASAAASAAKVARAKAKVKASSTKQNRTDTVISGDGEGGCSSNVNIGNIVSEKSINGKVNNEVIITGDVISIAGNGCK